MEDEKLSENMHLLEPIIFNWEKTDHLAPVYQGSGICVSGLGHFQFSYL